MGMLVFQIAKIGEKGQPLVDGVYTVPIRISDSGDCLSTIPLPGSGAPKFSDGDLSVEVLTVREHLSLEETGGAVASILAEMERIGGGTGSSGLPDESALPKAIASLMLVRYLTEKPPSMEKFWIVQRELRSEGLDICIDESAILIGFCRRTEEQNRMPINLVGRLDRLSDRDGSLIDRDGLKRKHALIIGLGSIGSVLASDLARCGVGRFTIADAERLEWGNVVRHAAGLSDVGRLKSRIVSDLIVDRNPDAEVSEISLDLGSASRETYAHAVASADIVICATDNRVSRLMRFVDFFSRTTRRFCSSLPLS
jgi:hypothetical protein